jgi:hypothetical protein
VRHHGGADDRDGQVQGVRAGQTGQQAGRELVVVLAADGGEQVREAEP